MGIVLVASFALGPCWIGRNKDVHLKNDELGREFGEPLGPSLRKPVLDSDVLTLHVAEFAQPLPEGRQEMRNRRRGRGDAEPTNPGDLCRLLRLRGERRRQKAEGQGEDEWCASRYHTVLLGTIWFTRRA